MKLTNVDIEIMPSGEVCFQRELPGGYGRDKKRGIVTRKLCAESITELRHIANMLMEGKAHGQ